MKLEDIPDIPNGWRWNEAYHFYEFYWDNRLIISFTDSFVFSKGFPKNLYEEIRKVK